MRLSWIMGGFVPAAPSGKSGGFFSQTLDMTFDFGIIKGVAVVWDFFTAS